MQNHLLNIRKNTAVSVYNNTDCFFKSEQKTMSKTKTRLLRQRNFRYDNLNNTTKKHHKVPTCYNSKQLSLKGLVKNKPKKKNSETKISSLNPI